MSAEHPGFVPIESKLSPDQQADLDRLDAFSGSLEKPTKVEEPIPRPEARKPREQEKKERAAKPPIKIGDRVRDGQATGEAVKPSYTVTGISEDGKTLTVNVKGNSEEWPIDRASLKRKHANPEALPVVVANANKDDASTESESFFNPEDTAAVEDEIRRFINQKGEYRETYPILGDGRIEVKKGHSADREEIEKLYTTAVAQSLTDLNLEMRVAGNVFVIRVTKKPKSTPDFIGSAPQGKVMDQAPENLPIAEAAAERVEEPTMPKEDVPSPAPEPQSEPHVVPKVHTARILSPEEIASRKEKKAEPENIIDAEFEDIEPGPTKPAATGEPTESDKPQHEPSAASDSNTSSSFNNGRKGLWNTIKDKLRGYGEEVLQEASEFKTDAYVDLRADFWDRFGISIQNWAYQRHDANLVRLVSRRQTVIDERHSIEKTMTDLANEFESLKSLRGSISPKNEILYHKEREKYERKLIAIRAKENEYDQKIVTQNSRKLIYESARNGIAEKTAERIAGRLKPYKEKLDVAQKNLEQLDGLIAKFAADVKSFHAEYDELEKEYKDVRFSFGKNERKEQRKEKIKKIRPLLAFAEQQLRESEKNRLEAQYELLDIQEDFNYWHDKHSEFAAVSQIKGFYPETHFDRVPQASTSSSESESTRTETIQTPVETSKSALPDKLREAWNERFGLKDRIDEKSFNDFLKTSKFPLDKPMGILEFGNICKRYLEQQRAAGKIKTKSKDIEKKLNYFQSTYKAA